MPVSGEMSPDSRPCGGDGGSARAAAEQPCLLHRHSASPITGCGVTGEDSPELRAFYDAAFAG
ncbi:hypothetical protein GCM10009792_02880 [Microcella alkalica]|uniref:Uncharacterized protein n=1 Tax=Microcella alkalica TaxID=355930 RepID=A0A839E5T7_9MICO|nr:hypothetical protein [Microcella alkalica]MBA8848029.1 hypothetical protein [Microcella alkalica]